MATQKRTVDVELSTSGLDAQGRPVRKPLVTDESGNVMTMDAPAVRPFKPEQAAHQRRDDHRFRPDLMMRRATEWRVEVAR